MSNFFVDKECYVFQSNSVVIAFELSYSFNWTSFQFDLECGKDMKSSRHDTVGILML